MITMCWVDSEGDDRWERFKNNDDLIDFLIMNNMLEEEDALIFPSDIEQYDIEGYLEEMKKKILND